MRKPLIKLSEIVWQVMIDGGFPQHFIRVVESLYQIGLDRKCACDVTLGRVCAAIVAVETH
jgi:hypothetical protein